MFSSPRRPLTAALIAAGLALLGSAGSAMATSTRGDMGVGAFVVAPSCVVSLAASGTGAVTAQCGAPGQAMPAQSAADAPRILRQTGGEAGPAGTGRFITISY